MTVYTDLYPPLKALLPLGVALIALVCLMSLRPRGIETIPAFFLAWLLGIVASLPAFYWLGDNEVTNRVLTPWCIGMLFPLLAAQLTWLLFARADFIVQLSVPVLVGLLTAPAMVLAVVILSLANSR
ncbi:hypothetical protein [Bryobacter aggregatus]|uniref:hypothetical protein n=1 Tax=Bryobacter aggregatus TaxID=360054 RepID=UPI0004E24789|nr:hypothetical protein [Bryobacter aggregatus]